MSSDRRRQVIVNKPFQNRIVLAASWMPWLCLMTSAVLMAIYCRRLNDEAMRIDVALPSVGPVFLTSVGFIFFATVFTLVQGIRLSHRIAGPVVNIERALERFRKGDRTARIHLRRHDLLAGAADRMNDFLDWAEEQLPPGPASPSGVDAMAADWPTPPQDREPARSDER